MKPSTKHRLTGIFGFTLLELSVVLAVIATILGGIITLTSAALEGRAYNATVAKLKVLQQALYDYRIAYNMLPCPANSTTAASSNGFGIASTSVDCIGGSPAADLADGTAAVGMVPIRTLGLPDEMGVDGWGRRIRYAVANPFIVSDSFDDAAATPGSTTALITVTNNDSGATLSSTVAFVLVSYGRNGHGARAGALGSTASLGSSINGGITNINELLNCKCFSTGAGNGTSDLDAFVQGDPKPDPADPLNEFDDVVVFSTRAELRDATE